MAFRHEYIETNVILLTVLTLLTVAIGGLVQIVPMKLPTNPVVDFSYGVTAYSTATGKNIPLSPLGSRDPRPATLLDRRGRRPCDRRGRARHMVG